MEATEKDLTAAARSNWPGAEPPGLTAPGRGTDGAGVGLVAVGMGGLPGSFGAAGLEATGGGGAGFFPTGGGGGFTAPTALDGLDVAGVIPADASGVLFHGAAVPLGGAIPGNTDTGFAEAFAVRDCTGILGCCCVCGALGFGVTAGAVGGAGGRRGAGGGAGGGAGAAFGFGGTSSR